MFDLYAHVKNPMGVVIIFVSVFFGLVHRHIHNIALRQWTSTLFGFGLCALACSNAPWHILLFISLPSVNYALIKIVGHKLCHTAVTIYTMAFFITFRYRNGDKALTDYYAEDLYFMVLTARMIGLGSDVHYSNMAKSKSGEKKTSLPFDDYVTNPSYSDTLHFFFCYIGMNGGFFARYRTYDDFIQGRFLTSNNMDKHIIVKCIVAFIISYIYFPLHANYWDISYMKTDAYINSGIAYKIAFASMYMQGFALFLILMSVLCELQCKTAGFGLYPVVCKNISGHGPSQNYKQLREMSKDKLKKEKFDYVTIHNFDAKVILTSPWGTEVIKVWNKTYQYWLSIAIYENFINRPNMKVVGMACTMFFSSIWHGFLPGFHVTSLIFVLCLIVNRKYYKVYKDFLIHDPLVNISYLWKHLYLVFMYILRFYVFGYAMFNFVLNSWEDVVGYMSDVYCVPIIIHVIIQLIGDAMYERLKKTHKVK